MSTIVYKDGEFVVRSFWAGVGRGTCLQIECGGKRVQLESDKVADLVLVLLKWLGWRGKSLGI